MKLQPRPAAPPTPEPVDTARVYENVATQVDTLARKLKGDSPSYPSGRAPKLRSGQRVSVLLHFVVTETGEVTDVTVVESAGKRRGRRRGVRGQDLEVRAGDQARSQGEGGDQLPLHFRGGLSSVAKLIVNPTASNRREIPLTRTTILTIGRDPSNDLVLPDAMVSRRHAVVENRGRQFFLRDCSSANGSVVNGDRVTERALRDGDLVAIGSMRLLFREESVEASGGKVLAHPSAAPLECPACKSVYRRGDLFCRECGAQVAQPSGPPKAVCGACGAAVPLPARFCNSCGGTLAPDGQRLVDPPVSDEAAKSRDTQPGAPWLRSPRRRAAAELSRCSRRRSPRSRRTRRTPSRASSGRLRAKGAASPPPPATGVELADPGSRLAAFVVDTVFVVSGQAVLLAPVGWYWWAREAPRTASDVTLLPVFASVTLLPLALLLGALVPRLFLEREGRHPRQGAAGPARGHGRGAVADSARERREARARLPALGRKPRHRLPDGGVRRARPARGELQHTPAEMLPTHLLDRGFDRLGVRVRGHRRPPAYGRGCMHRGYKLASAGGTTGQCAGHEVCDRHRPGPHRCARTADPRLGIAGAGGRRADGGGAGVLRGTAARRTPGRDQGRHRHVRPSHRARDAAVRRAPAAGRRRLRRPAASRGRRGRGQDGLHRARVLRPRADPEPGRPRAHAGRVLQRIRRGRRRRHGPGRAGHADGRLDHPAGLLLRRDGLRREPRPPSARRRPAPEPLLRRPRDHRPLDRRHRPAYGG